MFLITGSRGQLGSELRDLLGEKAEYVDRDDLDIADAACVREFFRGKSYEAIVNCAAYTAVDKAESDSGEAARINAEGPRNLARTGLPLIQISTDYVFAGDKGKPYDEEDPTDPSTVYGKTKLAGEQAVWQEASGCIVIRTAWLYSTYGSNFVKTMRRLGRERRQLSVVADQVGTPTYARDLAEAVGICLQGLKPGVKALYHFSNEGACTWYDLALAVMELSHLPCEVVPIESAQFPSAASRPFYSVLAKTRWKKVSNRSVPHWREALGRCIERLEFLENSGNQHR